jgi:hypothetical protein
MSTININLKHDNIISAISSISVGKGIAKNSNPYFYLDLNFKNGFRKRVFLDDASVFALRDAMTISGIKIPTEVNINN